LTLAELEANKQTQSAQRHHLRDTQPEDMTDRRLELFEHILQTMSYRLLPLLLLLTAVLLFGELRGGKELFPSPEAKPLFASLEKGWDRLSDVTHQDLLKMRDEVLDAFDEDYAYYLSYAFPMDDLKPISCRGKNSEGGIAMTLLDILDTFIVMNRSEELKTAVQLIERHVRFDVDHLVNVFEVNIRALGGLLSAHMLLERNPAILPDYNGSLLAAALDLGQRLLPAFERNPTLPSGRINLKTGDVFRSDGYVPLDINETCASCAGTFLVEMGMLSRLTGTKIFETKAKEAIRAIFRIRSQLGLLGRIVEIPVEEWKIKVSSIGASSDSLYEYLLKAYLLFGDEEYLDMFVELYLAVMHHQKTPELVGGYRWLADVHSDEGFVVGPWLSSLSAFWPGMQVLAGQIEDAQHLHCNYTNIWKNFAALPELFSVDGNRRHPQQSGYPLRPELIESNFYLYAQTKDPYYLTLGRMFHKGVLSTNTFICGHANIKDVATGELDDGKDSFFLSETLKYLFLLHSNITSIIDAFIFSTQAHVFPPLPAPKSKTLTHTKSIPECREVCSEKSEEQLKRDMEELHLKFPLLRVSADDFNLIRYRRCAACMKISTKRETTPRPVINRDHHTMYIEWALPHTRNEGSGTQGSESDQRKPKDDAYVTAATVRCLLEQDSSTKLFSCGEIEAVSMREITFGNIPSRDRTIFLSLRRPRKDLQRANLVLATNLRWLEMEGELLHRNRLKLDDSMAQVCSSRVLSTITISDDEVQPRQKLNKCKRTLVYGRVVDVQPLSKCGRIYNIQDVADAIAVLDDACISSERIQQIVDAGCRAIIIIQSSDTEKLPNSDLTSDILVLYVSQSSGIRIQRALEEGETQAMMGMTTSSSLTHCRHSPTVLERLTSAETKCSDLQVELVVPAKVQQRLDSIFPGSNRTSILERLVQDLSADDRIMEALLQSEQQERQ